ncbi:hypothetical protein [Corynebacterium diphtheriae]|uniref:hypothetical protein n=1 Tax=Corynebacterium diphtheriae TaxID=1717 RepID=UPI0008FB812A|nr:hypothetical protein [Corynebacterium diphtheriae]OIR64034.1 hypothetical protein BHF76_01870 [Corynebacterium diphtheriae]OIR64689.1 hypothetical protein BHF73_11455 [Corynebacterium diphtheriae]OIR65376.1 hypothetical protein BHF77_10755 [Corynebacterium diphtheriae]OIR73390.1 hypothetical protein BHF78_08780 [Corynebacterium diphtheriae]OIR80137.1 hypothetical protein BHF83_09840 [Corynebacterium diphtheriae]
MAMTKQQWEAHRKHRTAWVATHGMWAGLVDENGEPICTLPLPVEYAAPSTRGAPVSGRALFSVLTDDDELHPLADELIADFGDVKNGALVPSAGASRYLVFEFAGGVRRFYRITHAFARGAGASPSLVEVHGSDGLTMLNRLIAFSSPPRVGTEFREFTRDWVGDQCEGKLYEKPRQLADWKMSTVADGATLSGPAVEVLSQLIKTSIEVGFKVWGKAQTWHVSNRKTGITSPYIAYTADDTYLWDSIGAIALQAGVAVDMRLWWPGDPQPEGLSLSTAAFVLDVVQAQEVTYG